MWTWQRLLQRCNFSSCEVLLIDAEGYDAKILRSVVKHCRSHPGSWPDLIQFETMGHADSIEGKGAEWGAIELLKKHGYVLLSFSDHDTHLAHEDKMARLDTWLASSWKCTNCARTKVFPYVTDDGVVICSECQSALRQQ